MSSINFRQRNVGRISDRLDFATEKFKSAKEKLGDLLDMGKSVLDTPEYVEAKMEVLYWQKRMIDLKKLHYTNFNKKGTQQVSLGSTVQVRYGTVTKEYTIVTSIEADPVNGCISDESPLGRALLNKKVSDVAVVKAPLGEYRYKIELVT